MTHRLYMSHRVWTLESAMKKAGFQGSVFDRIGTPECPCGPETVKEWGTRKKPPLPIHSQNLTQLEKEYNVKAPTQQEDYEACLKALKPGSQYK